MTDTDLPLAYDKSHGRQAPLLALVGAVASNQHTVGGTLNPVVHVLDTSRGTPDYIRHFNGELDVARPPPQSL